MGTLFLLALIRTVIVQAQASRTYDIEVKVTSDWCACLPGSDSSMYMRICHGDECSTFLSIPNGLPKGGKRYYFSITTPKDIGAIDKVQIVNMGTNSLCLDEVTVDGVEWDWSDWWWQPVGTTICFEAKSGGCSTMTVTGSDSDNWKEHKSKPCEFESILDATYSPTAASVIKAESPRLVSIPTDEETISNSASTSDSPSLAPSSSDGQYNEETESVSASPSVSPSVEPTSSEEGQYNASNETKDSFGEKLVANKEIIAIISGIVLIIVLIGCVLGCYKHRLFKKAGKGSKDYNLMDDDADEKSIEMTGDDIVLK